MQLIFEVCTSGSVEPAAQKTFDGAGGVIGRGSTCDWIIADPDRLVSSHHGLVSYHDGEYFLTDISSNGIGVAGSAERLLRGHARLISEGDVYQLGSVDIRARLMGHLQQALASDAVIPDDAFLGTDPLRAMDIEQQQRDSPAELEALTTALQALAQTIGQGTVEGDHMVLPRWAEPVRDLPAAAAPPAHDGFWLQFGAALGIPLDSLDIPERDAMAIKVAGLFRKTIEGLQQSLRNRDELNSELNQGWVSPAPKQHNPLKDCADGQATMAALLSPEEFGSRTAELAIADAYRDIQVHQLALVVACRASVHSALAVFAPGRLLIRFEHEGKPSRFSTDGAHWRAYQRHYERMTDQDALVGQIFRHDFCNAYAEQVRLVSTLQTT